MPKLRSYWFAVFFILLAVVLIVFSTPLIGVLLAIGGTLLLWLGYLLLRIIALFLLPNTIEKIDGLKMKTEEINQFLQDYERALKEAEFDFSVGKLPSEEYQFMVLSYRRKMNRLMDVANLIQDGKQYHYELARAEIFQIEKRKKNVGEQR